MAFVYDDKWRSLLRRHLWFVTLVPALVLLACHHDMSASNPAGPSASGSTAAIGETLRLKVGESATLDGKVTLRFDRVSDDSRCPIGVTCVWEGDAVVHLTVSVSGDAAAVALHSNSSFAQSALHRGYTVRLTELAPMPRENQPVAASAYVASLVVSAS